MLTSGNYQFRRRRFAWGRAGLALILSGTILVSGIRPALGAGTRSTAASSQTTLTIQNLSFMGKQVAPVIAGFEKMYPNVSVSVQSITAGQFNSNLVQLSSNNPPDVGWVPINRPVYTQLLKANDLVPLGDVWKAADLQKRYGATYAASISGGSTPYVVAIDYIYYDVLIYNRTLFAKLGIPEPVNHRFSSFVQLAQDVSKLKAAGYAGIANSGNNGYASAALVGGWLPTSATPAQLTNYITNWNPRVPITAKYTDPAFVNVLAKMKELADQGYYQNGFLGQTTDQANALFSSGKAGMVWGGSFVSSLRQPGVDLGWALVPPITPGRSSQLSVFSDTIGIPIHAQHIALAKKFLAYYMSQQAQTAVAAAGVNFAAVNDVPASALQQMDPLMRQEVLFAQAHGIQNGWDSVVPGAIGQQALNPDVEEMYLGKLTPMAVAQKREAALLAFRAGM